ARNRRIGRHGLQDDGARGYARAGADLDIAENLGAGADEHALADLRMAIALLLAGTTERHALEERDVVLDHRRRADHDSGAVVDEHAAADLRGRVDVDAIDRRRAALE